MELVLTFIETVKLITLACWVLSLVWVVIGKKYLPSQITHTIFAAIMLVLEIPRILIKIQLAQNYEENIFFLVVWCMIVAENIYQLCKKNKTSTKK